MSRTSTSRRSRPRLKRIEVFSPEQSSDVRTANVVRFLKDCFPGLAVGSVESPFSGLRGRKAEKVSQALAASRVKNPSKRFETYEPMFGEVDYESRTLEGDAEISGVVYYGPRVQKIASALLGSAGGPEKASIVLTDRLVTTFSDDDRRHHLRTAVFGLPSIVSIPGMVEAPAKPREYYLARQQLEAEGAGQVELDRLKMEFGGRYLDYGMPELTEVAKGLCLQAVFYHLTLEPFCDDRDCRLFNSHWQEELIRSQIVSGRLCRQHAVLMDALSKEPSIMWL